MDALRRLLGLERETEPIAPARAPTVQEPVVMGSGWDLEVVGESFNQDALWALVAGYPAPGGRVRMPTVAVLVPEPDHPKDPNAVAVRIDGRHVGYLSTEDAEILQPGVIDLIHRQRRPIALHGTVVGFTSMSLGVFLTFDPAEFGADRELYPEARRRATGEEQAYDAVTVNPGLGLRTGLSEAISTDGEDDSYDLSWLDDLPIDDLAAIQKLRQLLHVDPDPIDRHYMYMELESRLYKARSSFESALSEYDAACQAHDSEMDTIRPALLEKFGVVPILGTYRQASIRHQKAKDWAMALWWARRGLEVYGDVPAKPDIVEDLREREAKYQVKLNEPPKKPRKQAPASTVVSARPATEVLQCHQCGRDFERQVTRGRKPKLCPDCRGA